MSNTTSKEKVEKAIKLLEELGFSANESMENFLEDNVRLFNNAYSHFLLNQKKLAIKCQELEKQHNCFVYAIIYSTKNDFEIYNFLVVPDNKENWDLLLQKSNKTTYLAYSYRYNITCEKLSGFEIILIKKTKNFELERII